jgi:crotonobetainyl-CoA:carnitine CoA-transferase CaiB-like acyl-CoA transferase
MSDMTSALADIRIVDFSHVFQGPVATQLLADFGADVIKVERPGSGDWSRSWGPFVGGVSMPYASLNRNKRSLAVDLKSPAGRQIVLRLIERADVLVHNFRAGTMEKLGLGYADLRTACPRLIYAYSSGWGDTGPYVERGRAGHDLMARAEGGWFYQADADTQPIPAGIPVDYPAGLMLAQAVLMALLARGRTGCGQLVTTDLLSVAMHAHAWSGAGELNAGRIRDADGVGETEKAIDKAFRTQDGWIEISPVFSPNALHDISVALGLGDLSQDTRFATRQLQIENSRALNAALAARFREKTTDDWIATLEPQGVLCAKIRTLTEAADDPQAQANRMIVEMQHPSAGALRLLGTPVRMYGTPPGYRIAPADLGEHTVEILRELDYPPQAIDELLRQGVVSRGTPNQSV